MAKRYITTNTNGMIGITEFAGAAPDDRRLARTLFALSRTTDTTTHFDPAVHTLGAIAAGIPGHRPLEFTAECEDSDLPADRYFRDAWEWVS